eukprot:scaffold41583_cov36-Phaeocystis_antarctica.AAC.2
MSQKWPSRGPKRTFLPLRDLSKEWAFHYKGGSARKNHPLENGGNESSFHPIIPFCCTLSDPESKKYHVWLATTNQPNPNYTCGEYGTHPRLSIALNSRKNGQLKYVALSD